METPPSRRIRGVRNPSCSLILACTLISAAGMSAAAFWKISGGQAARVPKFGHQAAESPLVMPEKAAVDMRLAFPDIWQAADIPEAPVFSPPLGTEQGALVYNAQKYWEMNEKRGARHAGDDLNGIGGMNTDLGDPVFCVGDGRVIYAGEPAPAWGKVVIVLHTGPDGKALQSMYAHLDKIGVTTGSLVARGTKLGTVGTANGHYPAHLHFEMRSGTAVEIGGGYANQPLNRLDPSATLAGHDGGGGNFAPAPLSRMD